MKPIYKEFSCSICNKPRGRHFNHSECSKKLQESYNHKDVVKKPTVLTEKRINQFLKTLGE